MNPSLYSIRMHASRQGEHLSGAEQLVFPEALPALAAALVARALEHERGQAETLRLSVERLDPATLVHGRLPDLRSVRAADVAAARAQARVLLVRAGVAAAAADRAIAWLATGPAPGGGAMRGAMLVDAGSGERREADPVRGVRATRLGLAPTLESRLRASLAGHGLDNPHVREALVLAAKVQAAPGIVAELCWSDDPSYLTGYVCAPALGYVRLTPLKEPGTPQGGRAFFVRPGADLALLESFLRETPFVADALGAVAGEERAP